MVSISCITYNHVNYIKQCLDGFLMQQCNFDFEILIHDDASTDGTSDIILEYQKKYPHIIKPIIQTQNQWSKGVRGINATFNYPRAQGKYIALCEGDDYWIDPLNLQKQIDFLEDNPDFVMSFTNRYGLKDNKLIENNREEYSKDVFSKDDIPIYVPVLTRVFKKSCIENFNLNTQFGGDTLLLTWISNYGKFKFINEYTAVYRIHDKGIWSGLDYVSKCEFVIKTNIDCIVITTSKKTKFNFENEILKNLILILTVNKKYDFKYISKLVFKIPPFFTLQFFLKFLFIIFLLKTGLLKSYKIKKYLYNLIKWN